MQENPWTHMSGPFVEISKSKSESQTSIMADPDVQRSYSSMCAHAEVLSHFAFCLMFVHVQENLQVPG